MIIKLYRITFLDDSSFSFDHVESTATSVYNFITFIGDFTIEHILTSSAHNSMFANFMESTRSII